MKQFAEDEVVLRRYLLGDLTPEEQMQIDERLFLESDYFQQLQGVEDDLIDDYVAGELSAEERESFSKFLLSKPERYTDLRIAAALQKYLRRSADDVPTESDAEGRPPATSKTSFLPFPRIHTTLRPLLMAATLLIVLGGLWVVFKVMRRPNETEPGQAQRQSQQEKGTEQPPTTPQRDAQQEEAANSNANVQREQEQYAEQQNRSGKGVDEQTGSANKRERSNQRRGQGASPRQPSVQYSFLLLPGGPVRGGGEANTLTVPSDAGVVNLQLPLIGDADYRFYRAELKTTDNITLLTRTGLKPTTTSSGKIVSIKVPAGLLHQQKYRVELLGVTADGETREISASNFQVVKK